MNNASLAHRTDDALSAEMVATLGAAQLFAAASRAARTRCLFDAGWRRFAAWCHAAGADPLTPSSVGLFMAHRAESGAKASTIGVDLTAICAGYRRAGLESPRKLPAIADVYAGIRRTKDAREVGRAPFTVVELRRAVRSLPRDTRGLRDRALLVLGFAGAFRRSELVALEVAHLAFVAEGLVVTLPSSKTDQEGTADPVAIPSGRAVDTCPVRVLRAWLDVAGITEGPVFQAVDRWGHARGRALDGKDVDRTVKRAATVIGLDASRYGAHSLRAGFATTCAQEGVAEYEIKRQGRWKSSAVQRYIRHATAFDRNAAGMIGL